MHINANKTTQRQFRSNRELVMLHEFPKQCHLVGGAVLVSDKVDEVLVVIGHWYGSTYQ